MSEQHKQEEQFTYIDPETAKALPSINKQRLVDLFCRIVSIDSPSFGERKIADFLIEKLKSLGLSPAEDDCAAKISGNAGNLYTYVEGTGALADLPPILLCGHMDTVEPSCRKKAIVHPDGKITSDGTTVLGADDVGALTSILEALTVLRENKLTHRPLEIVFFAAEEPYGAGSAVFDYRKLKSKECYVFDLTGPIGGAALEAPTLISFDAIFHGRASHAGFAPQDGIHAIRAAALAITRTQMGQVDPKTTVNIGLISGGTGTNIVPAECSIGGEVRSFDDARAVSLIKEIGEICQKATEEIGASVTFESKRRITAYHTPQDSPVAQRYAEACGTLGIPAAFCSTHGGSDNNCLVQHGLQGIVPAAAMNACHSCQEYSNTDDLLRCSEVVLRLMTSKG